MSQPIGSQDHPTQAPAASLLGPRILNSLAIKKPHNERTLRAVQGSKKIPNSQLGHLQCLFQVLSNGKSCDLIESNLRKFQLSPLRLWFVFDYQ